jgi:threonine synthase
MTEDVPPDRSEGGAQEEAPAADVHALLDGATPHTPILSPELASIAQIAGDRRQELETRLEAFEDVADSDVGDTSLNRARNLEREIGLRQVYLKFDGGNPTGTQKDRIAFAQAMDALRRGFDAVTMATCGNYGAAMAVAASVAGLRCFVYIPDGCLTRRLAEMEGFGAEIVRSPGGYEEAVARSREHAARDEIYDANPGGDNTPIQLKAYGEIAFEIYDELRDAPAAVAISVSNGTTLAGIYRGFLSLYRRGKTSRMPRFIAGSSWNKNPIVSGFLKNRLYCDDLSRERIRETSINEPLVNWHSVDGDLALEAIRRTNGVADHVSDREMTVLARTMRELEGLSVLPAATAGLHSLIEHHKRQPLAGDRYVAVLTGRKA